MQILDDQFLLLKSSPILFLFYIVIRDLVPFIRARVSNGKHKTIDPPCAPNLIKLTNRIDSLEDKSVLFHKACHERHVKLDVDWKDDIKHVYHRLTELDNGWKENLHQVYNRLTSIEEFLRKH